jgi:hypothetical protein
VLNAWKWPNAPLPSRISCSLAPCQGAGVSLFFLGGCRTSAGPEAADAATFVDVHERLNSALLTVAAHARFPYLERHPLPQYSPAFQSHARSPIQAAAHCTADRSCGDGAWGLAAPGASPSEPPLEGADNAGGGLREGHAARREAGCIVAGMCDKTLWRETTLASVRTSEAASAHWIPAPSTKLRQSPPFSMAACAVGLGDELPFNALAANGGSGAGQ